MKDKAERMRLEAEAWKQTAMRLSRQAVLANKCPENSTDEMCLDLHCPECWLVCAFREAVEQTEELACMRKGKLTIEYTAKKTEGQEAEGDERGECGCDEPDEVQGSRRGRVQADRQGEE